MGRPAAPLQPAAVERAQQARRARALTRGPHPGVIAAAALGLVAVGLVAGWSLRHREPAARREPESKPGISLAATVAALTAPELEGRLAGAPGEALAAKLLVREFDRLGLSPVAPWGRLQPFTFADHGQTLRAAGNVLGEVDVGAQETVVVGAHYDHLGQGGPLARDPFVHGVHPGADDDASGVAVLLALAERYASEAHRAKVNLLFVAFTAEEEGLYGSQALVRSPAFAALHPRCYLNLDMVGRLDPAQPILGVEGTLESPALASLVAAVPPRGFSVRTADGLEPGGTDASTFAAAGIPVLALSTGQTDDYHKRSDVPERLNFAGMEAVVDYAAGLIDALGSAPATLASRQPAAH